MEIPDYSPLFIAVVLFKWAVFIWDEYLTWRQRRVVLNKTTVPEPLSHVLDEETMNKTRRYSLDKMTFGFWQSLYSEVETNIILLLFALPWAWDRSGDILNKVPLDWIKDSEIFQSLIFVFFFSVFGLITGLPWSIYSTFVLEARHNFNKQTPGFFVKDTIKKFIVMQLIAMPLLALLIWIIKIGGPYFFVYAWLFTLAVSIVLITVYPSYIAPLFDKFTPMEEGPLKTAIEKLASSVQFPLAELFVVEGSKRSSHSNAYFVGLIKKRIVLFDTLMVGLHPDNKVDEEKKDKAGENQDENKEAEQPTTSGEKKTTNEKKRKGCTDEEVLAVLGHELGHWKMWHIPKNFLISAINTFLCFAVFAYLYQKPEIYQAFGFHNSMPILIGLFIIFQFIFGPYEMILSFAMTLLSRRFEFQADEYAVKLELEGKLDDGSTKLKSALIQLQVDNLGFPYSDWLYSTFYYSHPPILDRLKGIDAAKEALSKKTD
ncbi:CAAX prenyl protease 1 homolog [Symsagittifera roscoffensis]|uniref:CAAX prenyl protease 1 homolog n=1 Tax=Symsagittifera roscoffensis TaxID=84072 RepID=UPI00307BB39A